MCDADVKKTVRIWCIKQAPLKHYSKHTFKALKFSKNRAASFIFSKENDNKIWDSGLSLNRKNCSWQAYSSNPLLIKKVAVIRRKVFLFVSPCGQLCCRSRLFDCTLLDFIAWWILALCSRNLAIYITSDHTVRQTRILYYKLSSRSVVERFL